MQSFNLLQLAVLAAAFASAAPVAQPDSVNETADIIFKRADPTPVSCGPTDNQRAWPLESVQDAYTALVNLGNTPNPQKPAAGTRYYPRQYGSPTPSDADVVTALNGIPECATGQTGYKYFEFPITDPTFAGGAAMSQGPDRVIAISAPIGQGGTRTFTYCLAVTHRGAATAAAFVPCTNAP